MAPGVALPSKKGGLCKKSREQRTVGQESSAAISRESRGTRRHAAAGRQRSQQQARLASIRRRRGDERRGREQDRVGRTGGAVLVTAVVVAALPSSSRFGCSGGALSACATNKCDTKDESSCGSSFPRGYDGLRRDGAVGATEGCVRLRKMQDRRTVGRYMDGAPASGGRLRRRMRNGETSCFLQGADPSAGRLEWRPWFAPAPPNPTTAELPRRLLMTDRRQTQSVPRHRASPSPPNSSCYAFRPPWATHHGCAISCPAGAVQAAPGATGEKQKTELTNAATY